MMTLQKGFGLESIEAENLRKLEMRQPALAEQFQRVGTAYFHIKIGRVAEQFSLHFSRQIKGNTQSHNEALHKVKSTRV